MNFIFVIVGSAVGPKQKMHVLLLDNTSDFLHVLSGHSHTAQAAFPVERDVSSPGIIVDPPRAVDHDAPGIGMTIRPFKTLKVVSAFVLCSVPACHLELAEGRAVTSRDVAEHGLPGCASLPRSVHRISPVHDLPLFEGPDEHPGASTGDAVVHEHAVIRAQTVPSGVSERLFRTFLDPLVALPRLVPHPAERQGQSRDDQGHHENEDRDDGFLLHVQGCLIRILTKRESS